MKTSSIIWTLAVVAVVLIGGTYFMSQGSSSQPAYQPATTKNVTPSPSSSTPSQYAPATSTSSSKTGKTSTSTKTK